MNWCKGVLENGHSLAKENNMTYQWKRQENLSLDTGASQNCAKEGHNVMTDDCLVRSCEIK